jgi:tetratricopeptide (TPR) repeat protein
MSQAFEAPSITPDQREVTASTSSWMDGLEVFSVVVSIGGAVAAAAMQQVAVAAIPLSFTAALNLANRKRLINEMANAQAAATAQIVQVQQQQTQQRDTFQTQFESVTAQVVPLEAAQAEVQQKIQALESKDTDIETVLEKLREIDRFTQAIRTNPKAAEFYFQRGQVRQSLSRMEDNRLAIEDYTQAVQLEPTLAKAYFQRGCLRSELGERRQAGEDLRLAAKSYFDQGDMDNYAEAKRLSEQIYEKSEPRVLTTSEEKLRVADLFA